MTPYDIHRCTGMPVPFGIQPNHEQCRTCVRRAPGDPDYQWFLTPEIVDGVCKSKEEVK